jgi:hypothetical protein
VTARPDQLTAAAATALDRPVEDRGAARRLAAATRIARLLDQRFVDPLLGLFLPGFGDLVGAALGLYVVAEAWRRRAPKVLIARMLLNLSVDLLSGLVPVLGDIWDFLFRANTRNLELLQRRSHGSAAHAGPGDWLVVGAAGALFLGALSAPVLVIIALVRALTG